MANKDTQSDDLGFGGLNTDEEHIDIFDREYAIYRCRDCANVVLSMQDCENMTCHGEYSLTERGRALEETVSALVQWGTECASGGESQ